MSYDETTHNNHWAETREILSSIPKNNVICWCTDNNGQIAQSKENKEQVGKWTLGNNTEPGNGKQMENVCKEYDIICSNTHFKPHNGKKDELATWYSYNGETKRQIDYFNISKKHRNWVRNITNNQLANTRQNMQHKLVKIKLQIKLKRDINSNTKNNNIYDLKEFRLNPGKCKEDINTIIHENKKHKNKQLEYTSR